jgi:hypothetical protein
LTSPEWDLKKTARVKLSLLSNAGLIEAKMRRRIDYLKHNAKDTVDVLKYTLIHMPWEEGL